MSTPFVVGLDLGQVQDPSALAVVEQSLGATASDRPTYAVRYLQRWRLGTAYGQIVGDVTALLQRPPLAGATTALVVDATGVGAAVVELFRAATFGADLLVAVTITAGAEAAPVDAGKRAWRVPKRDLVGTTQVLLQERRLKVAATLGEAEALARELEGFRVRISAAGHDSWRGEGSTHDDLVLAVALACWWAEREGTGQGFAFIGGRVLDLAEGRVVAHWDPFDERFVEPAGGGLGKAGAP